MIIFKRTLLHPSWFLIFLCAKTLIYSLTYRYLQRLPLWRLFCRTRSMWQRHAWWIWRFYFCGELSVAKVRLCRMRSTEGWQTASSKQWLKKVEIVAISIEWDLSSDVLWHFWCVLLQPLGPLAVYKGFTPTLVRQMPYVMITWVTVEQIKAFFANSSWSCYPYDSILYIDWYN